MSQGLQTAGNTFVERRKDDVPLTPPAFERRQFTNGHEDLTPEALELALAIDGYKMRHRRRVVDFEEMLAVVKSLGYHK
jgi:hypothetical protein